jgi:hypothetical protein
MNYKTKILELVLFVIVFAGFTFAQFEFEPKTVIRPMKYDFGDIIQDSVITTIFVITNEGSDLLKIDTVWASCGCTAVMPAKKELKPGESTDLKVTFNSKGRSGRQRKTINVETNDPNNSTLKLALTGNVIKKEKSAETVK